MSSCDKIEQERKTYLKKMWGAIPFTKKRREYEKKANDAARRLTACRKGAKNGKNAKKGDKGLFRPGFSPEQLWVMDPNKRKIDLSGIFSPEDTIVAVARGMRPGVLRGAEDKAIVTAGLAVLKAAGKPAPKNRNAASVRAAVAKHGKGLMRAAWGARGLLLLGSAGMKAATAAHSLVPAIAVSAGPIGAIVAAAAGAHIGITSAIAKGVAAEMDGYVKSGLAAFKRGAAPVDESAADGGSPPAVLPADSTSILPYAAGAAVILLGAVAWQRSSK